MPSQPLSVARISELTQISRRTIQRAIANGDLTAHKLGGATSAYVVNEKDLDAWLSSRTEQAS